MKITNSSQQAVGLILLPPKPHFLLTHRKMAIEFIPTKPDIERSLFSSEA